MAQLDNFLLHAARREMGPSYERLLAVRSIEVPLDIFEDSDAEVSSIHGLYLGDAVVVEVCCSGGLPASVSWPFSASHAVDPEEGVGKLVTKALREFVRTHNEPAVQASLDRNEALEAFQFALRYFNETSMRLLPSSTMEELHSLSNATADAVIADVLSRKAKGLVSAETLISLAESFSRFMDIAMKALHEKDQD